MVKGGAEAVRTSSAEYAVVDGVMMARGDPEQSCTDGTCSQPLKLSQVRSRAHLDLCGCVCLALRCFLQALQTGALSSQVSDKDLEELRQMKIGNEGSWISFQVFAVARYQGTHLHQCVLRAIRSKCSLTFVAVSDADSEFGSIVAIYTHLGEIYLNGQEITFHESLEGAFTRAGFAVDGSRRRLLGVVEVLGLFNFLSQALSTSAIGNITTFLEGIPTYNGVISKFQYCETPVQDACKFVGPDGPWVNHVVDFNGGKALKQTEEQALYAIDGKPHSVTVVTSLQYAAQEKFLVRNETHLLKYQRHKNVNYFCEVEQDDGLKSVVAGATPAGEGVATNDIESEFLGEIDMVDTYGVVPCKYWKVEVKSTSFVLFYFETIDSPRMFQMNVSNYAYRFDSIEFGTSGLEFKTMKEAPSELDMQATLASCHPEGVIPPWKMKENELTNTILEDPAWGQRDTTPPVVQTPITNLNAAQAAALQLEYSTLTTAQWATECPDGAGAGVCAAVWCKKGTGGGAVIPGINFNHTEYEPCDPNNRRTGGTTSVQTVVALDFTDSPGTQDCTYEKIAGAGAGNSPTTYTVDCDCFEGSGTMTITRTCPADPCDAGAGSCSIQTSGSTSISFKTLQCFGSMFSTLANRAAGLLQASDADGVLDISSTLNTNDQFGEQVVGEFPADGAGSLCPATKFGNAGTVLAFDNLDNDGNPPSSTKSREFSDGTNLIMRVEASVTMDVLVVPITTCSAGQQAGGGFPTSNAQMGFRLGMSVQGNVVLNVAFSNGAWRYSNASPHIYTFSANRKIFPEPDGTLFCNRNANGPGWPCEHGRSVSGSVLVMRSKLWLLITVESRKRNKARFVVSHLCSCRVQLAAYVQGLSLVARGCTTNAQSGHTPAQAQAQAQGFTKLTRRLDTSSRDRQEGDTAEEEDAHEQSARTHTQHTHTNARTAKHPCADAERQRKKFRE
eukprot:2696210-Rhodomonas_salina.2